MTGADTPGEEHLHFHKTGMCDKPTVYQKGVDTADAPDVPAGLNRPDHELGDRRRGRGEQCEQGGLELRPGEVHWFQHLRGRVEDFISELKLLPDVEDEDMADIAAAGLPNAVRKASPGRFRNNPDVTLLIKIKYDEIVALAGTQEMAEQVMVEAFCT